MRFDENPDVDLQLKMNGYRTPPLATPRPICPDVPDTPPPTDLAQGSLVGSIGEVLAWVLLVGMCSAALWKAIAPLLDMPE